MYTRKTCDIYSIEGLYYGEWSEETAETSWTEAKIQLKCYRINCPQTSFRIRKHREKIV